MIGPAPLKAQPQPPSQRPRLLPPAEAITPPMSVRAGSTLARRGEPLPAPSPAELALQPLIQDVLSRNPTLAQMYAAWEAAAARYPQVTSLDDPMLSGTIAPAAFGSNTIEGGYRIEY